MQNSYGMRAHVDKQSFFALQKLTREICTYFVQFVYNIYAAGDLPTDNAELQKYYEHLLSLEADFFKSVDDILNKGGPWKSDRTKDCECLSCRNDTVGWRLIT